jgi:hypothetical protein
MNCLEDGFSETELPVYDILGNSIREWGSASLKRQIAPWRELSGKPPDILLR